MTDPEKKDFGQQWDKVEPNGPWLDFSEFHPLDHWVGTKACRAMPGGWRSHLSLWHDYQAPDPLQDLMCRLGRHDIVRWHHSEGLGKPETHSWWGCSRCGWWRGSES